MKPIKLHEIVKNKPTVRDEWEKELDEILELNNPEGSYIHILTRVKSSKQVGTMSIEDFEKISNYQKPDSIPENTIT